MIRDWIHLAGKAGRRLRLVRKRRRGIKLARIVQGRFVVHGDTQWFRGCVEMHVCERPLPPIVPRSLLHEGIFRPVTLVLASTKAECHVRIVKQEPTGGHIGEKL
jgi:hypothetical protein